MPLADVASNTASAGTGRDNPALLDPKGFALTVDCLREAFRDLSEEAAAVLYPTEAPCGGLNRRDSYSCELHGKLCRRKLLGLSDRAAAKSLGMSNKTLTLLKRRYPKLAIDMDSAAEMSNAHAALLLRGLMEGGGPTAFQAIKFFLTTHSPEFKEVQDVNVHVDVGQTIRHIRTGLYGLPDQPGDGSDPAGQEDVSELIDAPAEQVGQAAVPAEVPADVPSPAAGRIGTAAAVAAAEAAAAEDVKASEAAGLSLQPTAATDWLNEL